MAVHPAHRRRSRPPFRWRLALCALAVCALAGAVLVTAVAVVPGDDDGASGTRRRAPLRGGSRPRGSSAAPPGHWQRVLHDLDRSRARAFAAGEPRGLDAVYVRGSPVLRHDRAVLDAYARRGLTVRGARLRLLDVRVRAASADRVALRVVDRLGPAVVGSGGGVARPLPRDHPTLHRLRLLRTPAGWRIAAVRTLSG